MLAGDDWSVVRSGPSGWICEAAGSGTGQEVANARAVGIVSGSPDGVKYEKQWLMDAGPEAIGNGVGVMKCIAVVARPRRQPDGRIRLKSGRVG